VAVQFLRAKGNPEELQKVVNGWFAQPFYMGGLKGEFEASIAARAQDTANEVPHGYRTIMTVDVQQDHVRYVVRAHNGERESVRMDYGQAPGLEEAEAVARKWSCVVVGVDAAFRQQQVVTFCIGRPGWIPIVGADGLMTDIRWTDMPIDGGAFKGHVVKSLRHRPNAWREELYKRIKTGKPKWSIAGEVGNDYKKEMCGEARVLRKGSRGQHVIEWVKTGPNHYWDCEVNQIALLEGTRAFIFDVAGEQEQQVQAPPQMPSGPFVGELEEIARQRRAAQSDGRDQLGEITERLWT
jgi:hypothetical protein